MTFLYRAGSHNHYRVFVTGLDNSAPWSVLELPAAIVAYTKHKGHLFLLLKPGNKLFHLEVEIKLRHKREPTAGSLLKCSLPQAVPIETYHYESERVTVVDFDYVKMTFKVLSNWRLPWVNTARCKLNMSLKDWGVDRKAGRVLQESARTKFLSEMSSKNQFIQANSFSVFCSSPSILRPADRCVLFHRSHRLVLEVPKKVRIIPHPHKPLYLREDFSMHRYQIIRGYEATEREEGLYSSLSNEYNSGHGVTVVEIV